MPRSTPNTASSTTAQTADADQPPGSNAETIAIPTAATPARRVGSTLTGRSSGTQRGLGTEASTRSSRDSTSSPSSATSGRTVTR